MPVRLSELVGAAARGDAEDADVTSITVDSRRVRPGALFVCLRGEHDDGHAYAADAVRAGASAVLASRPLDVGGRAPVVVVEDPLAELSRAAAALYGAPSSGLTCVGVTGTNGKTTTVHFIESIAAAAGAPFGAIGTLGARLRNAFEEQLEHTTPFAHDVQALLARFRDAGARGVVMEVSSHALALHRVDDVDFDVAVLTNVTRDHLDFHGTFEEYRSVKRSLFERTARGNRKPGGTCVLNADDPTGAALARELPRVLTYGIEGDAMLAASDVRYMRDGATFRIPHLGLAHFRIRLPGAFNVANALAAASAACALDVPVDAIASGLEDLHDVPGRMTPVEFGEIGVYVDYAHTPDGLANVLRAVRPLTAGSVICVFGCGGDRDPGKRPLMGAVVRRFADHAIVTSDNPRSEDPQAIVEDVLAGMREPTVRGATFEVELDRRAAIERALAMARPGDAVLIAGKGHEGYQLVGAHKLPFSDPGVARESIARLRA